MGCVEHASRMDSLQASGEVLNAGIDGDWVDHGICDDVDHGIQSAGTADRTLDDRGSAEFT